MIGGWINSENFRPFLEVTSQLVGYDFNDLDWDAISLGTAEAERAGDLYKFNWFDYNLGDLPLRFAESADIRIELDADPELERCVAVLMLVMQNYDCTPS